MRNHTSPAPVTTRTILETCFASFCNGWPNFRQMLFHSLINVTPLYTFYYGLKSQLSFGLGTDYVLSGHRNKENHPHMDTFLDASNTLLSFLYQISFTTPSHKAKSLSLSLFRVCSPTFIFPQYYYHLPPSLHTSQL